MAWRMLEPCKDCPFNETGPGRHLRDSLAPGRWDSICIGLEYGEYFICHKTGAETGDGSELVCAGALAYQEEMGVSSQYQRVCERLEYIAAQKQALS